MLSATVALTLFSAAAQAGTTVVTTLNGSQGWVAPASELSADGSVAITTRAPMDGNGSLQLTGDRTRTTFGNMFPGNGATTGIGTLGQFTDLAFKYQVDPTSTTSADPKYSPALRLVFQNNGVKDELIWEAAYQPGGYGAAPANGAWSGLTTGGFFYDKLAFDANNTAGLNDERTIAQWAAFFGAGSLVNAVYVGTGSGIEGGGAHYLAEVDDVTFKGTTYNFEVAGAAGVPEPASWALMILGFGSAGVMLRRRKLAAA